MHRCGPGGLTWARHRAVEEVSGYGGSEAEAGTRVRAHGPGGDRDGEERLQAGLGEGDFHSLRSQAVFAIPCRHLVAAPSLLAEFEHIGVGRGRLGAARCRNAARPNDGQTRSTGI